MSGCNYDRDDIIADLKDELSEKETMLQVLMKDMKLAQQEIKDLHEALDESLEKEKESYDDWKEERAFAKELAYRLLRKEVGDVDS